MEQNFEVELCPQLASKTSRLGMTRVAVLYLCGSGKSENPLFWPPSRLCLNITRLARFRATLRAINHLMNET
jgi:hypothetical protein